MAFNYSPKIITDGLVLYLDAANTRSYPTTGTIWSDLSRNNNNGTLINGSTFNSSNGGSIVFDGLDDYVELGTISNSSNPLMLNGSSLTLSGVVKKISGGDTFQRVIDKSIGTAASGGYSMWVDNERLGYSVAGRNWWTNLTNSSPLNVWNHINIVATSTSIVAYVNGVELLGTFFAGTFQTPPNTSANLRVGTWYNLTGREFKGNIAQVSIYNRALSATEILQNYNAIKGRYL